VDRPAHQVAEGGVDHPVAGQRQFAGERLGHHGGLEMHAIVAADVGDGAGQALFDQGLDAVGIHGRRGPGRGAVKQVAALAGRER